MTKIVNFAKTFSIIAFLAFCAMVAFGLLFAVATGPAHAGAPRVTAPPPNPVTLEMQQAKTAKFNAFMTCIGGRIFDVRADLAKLEEANNASGWAAANRDLAGFNAQVAIMDTELARLKPIYGCN